MKTPHQTVSPSALDPVPRPSDREIYVRPISGTHRERPVQDEASKEPMP